MKKYAKSSASRYLKLITTSYPNGSRTRYPSAILNDSIKHREFKLVLPMIPRDVIIVLIFSFLFLLISVILFFKDCLW